MLLSPSFSVISLPDKAFGKSFLFANTSRKASRSSSSWSCRWQMNIVILFSTKTTLYVIEAFDSMQVSILKFDTLPYARLKTKIKSYNPWQHGNFPNLFSLFWMSKCFLLLHFSSEFKQLFTNKTWTTICQYLSCKHKHFIMFCIMSLVRVCQRNRKLGRLCVQSYSNTLHKFTNHSSSLNKGNHGPHSVSHTSDLN